MDDLISRQVAIEALWKALYEYEDKTEKQFIESDELDVGVWISHRVFVQNMNDIDRQTILNLPSAQPEQRWIPCKERQPEEDGAYLVTLIYTDKKGIEHRYTSIQEFKYGMWVIFGMCSIEAWIPLPEPYKEG